MGNNIPVNVGNIKPVLTFEDTYKIIPMIKINSLYLYLLGFRTGYVHGHQP